MPALATRGGQCRQKKRNPVVNGRTTNTEGKTATATGDGRRQWRTARFAGNPPGRCRRWDKNYCFIGEPMKRILLALLFSLLCTTALFISADAAPITDSGFMGKTVGFTSNKDIFLETPIDYDMIGGMEYEAGKRIYLYSERPIEDSNFRSIMGIRLRDFSGMNSRAKIYIGAGVLDYLDDETEGYGSLIVSDGFYEVQVGANFPLSNANLLNINYRYSNDREAKNRFGIGFITHLD
jgi:hypothetical protein